MKVYKFLIRVFATIIVFILYVYVVLFIYRFFIFLNGNISLHQFKIAFLSIVFFALLVSLIQECIPGINKIDPNIEDLKK